MNTAAFWVIVFGIWIFTLQSKVKYLEGLVEKLLEGEREDSSDSKEKHEASTELNRVVNEEKVLEKIPMCDEENNVYIKPVKSTVKKPQVSVEAFKNESQEKASTLEEAPIPVKNMQESKKLEVSEPSWLMQMLKNYFTGGNLLVRIGGVILFFGLAFLLKYTVEHTTISIEFRLISLALLAVAFIVLGWRLREKEGAYGQILQGLGVAVLYLVIYGASKFYTLLSLEFAFVWMLVVVVLGSFLALKQSSLPLALFSTVGGFLVPILTATGEGSHVTLFTYYFFLNLGIFFMAWQQAWRVLNIVGFLFTFVIATSWGVLRYQAEFFSTIEPFLILYFLMYLAITVLFSRKSTNHLIDGTLLFGLPAVVFPLQIQVTSHLEYAGGYSAVAMGFLYVFLSKVLKGKIENTLLLQSFFALGVLFFTVAIPYFFDANITAAIWAMESSAIIWLSLKQKRVFVRYIAELLLFISIGLYIITQLENSMNFSIYLGYMIVVLATFFAAYQLEKNKEYLSADRYLPVVFLSLSFFVWMLSVWEVAVWYESYALMHKILLGFTVGTMLIVLADSLLSWKILSKILQVTLPIGIGIFVLSFTKMTYPLNPFGGLGALAFFLLMLWHTLILYRYDKRWEYVRYLHILSLWFAVAILTLALRHMMIANLANTTVIILSMSIFPLFAAFVLMKVNIKVGLSTYTKLYRYDGVGGLLTFLVIWEGVAFLVRADTLLLPYLPLLNPLDMMQIAVAYVIYTWVRYHKLEKIWGVTLYLMLVVLVTVVFARAMAHYGNYSYDLHTLWNDLYFQVGVVILWLIVLLISIKTYKRYEISAFKTGSIFLLIPLVLWELRAFSYAPNFIENYIPLLNLLDIAQLGVWSISAYWFYIFRKNFDNTNRDILYGVFGVLALILISVFFARAVHVYKEIPYLFSTLWDNLYFQTGLSLLWSAVAIILMLLSKRYSHRILWLAGFGLLILVVLKLFFVELASSGTIERIVSFIVVGVLLLFIGYFVPLPPVEDKESKEIDNS